MARKKSLALRGLLFLATVLIVGIFLLPVIHPVSSKISQCNMNLIYLHEAEQNWASRNDKPTNAIPTWDDLKEDIEPYAGRPGWTNGRPVCPKGGTYILVPVGEMPMCSIGGPGHDWGRVKLK
jgi:hypothetical protein